MWLARIVLECAMRSGVEEGGLEPRGALAWALGLGLFALHLDFWRSDAGRLVGGVLPEELVYRLVWMALAWGYLLWFCARIWQDEE